MSTERQVCGGVQAEADLRQPRRREAISRRFAIPAVTVLLAVMVIGIVVPLLGLHPLAGVPYWHTILGAILGLTLILFGDRLQSGMNALAHNGHRPDSDTGNDRR